MDNVQTVVTGVLAALNDGESIRRAILTIWLPCCLILRWAMVATHADGGHCGIIPSLLHILERWIDQDNVWGEAYLQLPAEGYQIGTSYLLRSDLKWPGRGRLIRLWSLLGWKRKYWFHPEGQLPGIATCRRRATYGRQDDGHTDAQLRSVVEPAWEPLISRDDQRERNPLATTDESIDNDLLLVYGLNVIFVERDAEPSPAQMETARVYAESFRVWKALRVLFLLLLFSLAVFSAAGLHKNAYQIVIYVLGSVHTVVCVSIAGWAFWFAHGLDDDDKKFLAVVTSNAERIEYRARFLKHQFARKSTTTDEHNRVVDVFLFYAGRKALCRCQPTPDGPDGMENTWIELWLPSSTPWPNKIQSILGLWIYTLMPWNWTSWPVNSVFALSYHAVSSYAIWQTGSSYGQWAGAIALFTALGTQILPRPEQSWKWLATGDRWIFCWYMFIFQVLVGNLILPTAWSDLYGVLKPALDLLFKPNGSNNTAPTNTAGQTTIS